MGVTGSAVYREKGGQADRMVTDAQKRAAAKYKREKTHSFSLRFFPADEELWEHLQRQARKAEYLKRLIREDMEGE